VVDLIEKQSSLNKIIYYVYDQNNLNRERVFFGIDNVVYQHIYWYDYSSISLHRQKVILYGEKTDFYLELNSNIEMNKSWDQELISNITTTSVISGKGSVTIEVDDFRINKKISTSDSLLETNYIDMDLIFLQSAQSLFLVKLNLLKDVGQDLYASLLFLNRGIKIVSLPSSFYRVAIQNNHDTYRPYSKNHGYNKMLDIVKSQSNTYFEEFHGVEVSKINYMPYQVDDVLYTNFKTSLDVTKEPKYHSGYSKIDIV
jgi:hypothetical protein